MGRKTTYCLILLLLVSCSSSRKSWVESAEHIDIERQMQMFESMHSMTYGIDVLNRWDSVWHNAVFTFRIYDTSMPDSCGVHPILAEGEMHVDGGSVSAINETMELQDTITFDAGTMAEENILDDNQSVSASDSEHKICEPWQWGVLGLLFLLLSIAFWVLNNKSTNK